MIVFVHNCRAKDIPDYVIEPVLVAEVLTLGVPPECAETWTRETMEAMKKRGADAST